MVLIDQKSDQKDAATVANHSDRAIISQFIRGLTQVYLTQLARMIDLYETVLID